MLIYSWLVQPALAGQLALAGHKFHSPGLRFAQRDEPHEIDDLGVGGVNPRAGQASARLEKDGDQIRIGPVRSVVMEFLSLGG